MNYVAFCFVKHSRYLLEKNLGHKAEKAYFISISQSFEAYLCNKYMSDYYGHKPVIGRSLIIACYWRVCCFQFEKHTIMQNGTCIIWKKRRYKVKFRQFQYFPESTQHLIWVPIYTLDAYSLRFFLSMGALTAVRLSHLTSNIQCNFYDF